MGRITFEPVRVFHPDFADIFVGGEGEQRLQSFGEVVGCEERFEGHRQVVQRVDS